MSTIEHVMVRLLIEHGLSTASINAVCDQSFKRNTSVEGNLILLLVIYALNRQDQAIFMMELTCLNCRYARHIAL